VRCGGGQIGYFDVQVEQNGIVLRMLRVDPTSGGLHALPLKRPFRFPGGERKPDGAAERRYRSVAKGVGPAH